MDTPHDSGSAPQPALADTLAVLDTKSLGKVMRESLDPGERKAAARELRRRQAEGQRRAAASKPASRGVAVEAAPQTPADVVGDASGVAGVPESGTPADVLAPLDDRPLARSILALTPEQRRELALVALDELKAQLVATSRVAVMKGGRVVGHEDVPDNSARFKAADRLLKLVAADIPADRAPSAPVIVIQTAPWMAPQAEVLDVTPREAATLALPA